MVPASSSSFSQQSLSQYHGASVTVGSCMANLKDLGSLLNHAGLTVCNRVPCNVSVFNEKKVNKGMRGYELNGISMQSERPKHPQATKCPVCYMFQFVVKQIKCVQIFKCAKCIVIYWLKFCSTQVEKITSCQGMKHVDIHMDNGIVVHL